MKILFLLLTVASTLNAQGFPTKRLVRHPGSLSRAAMVPKTVRVLALRVQFRKETVDDLKTTGNGHFMLVPADDPYRASEGRTIDPLPHDRPYFEDQMLALRNYYLDASDSNLIIDYDVKPDGRDSAYTLDRFMRYYGDSFLSQAQRDLRLAELFRDAVRLADSTDAIDFSQYDYVIVFHAGAGQDFNSDDFTPDDVASRFVSLQLLQNWAGDGSYPGISVNGGTRVVSSGVLVPETESQEVIDALGFSVFTEIGLTGILASNFGSQLGMPDMFNTETGTAGIGVFGLLDQGAVNGDGLIPAEPDPWTKIYMGWAKPTVIQNGTGISLLPKKLLGRSNILKIPINASEYFLVENRQRDIIPNSLSPTTITRAIKDSNSTTGQVTFDTLYHAGADRSASTGVVTRVDEYDAGLPGTGLLVWQIAEEIIEQGLPSNAINNQIERRGVRIVEGSGSQEIGYRFTFGPFSVVDAGNDSDFFFFENDLFKRFNRSDSVFLTPSSVPSSLGYDRVNSGIHMTGISARQWVMTFDLRTSVMQKGFPQFTGSAFNNNALTYGDVAGDNRSELIAVAANGDIFAWDADGQPLFANAVTRTDRRLGEDSTVYPVALFAQADDSIAVSCAVADLDGDAKAEVITGSVTGRVAVWKAIDSDFNGLADTLFTYDAGSRITAPILIVSGGNRIVVGDGSGQLHVVTFAGAAERVISLGDAVVGLSVISADSLYWQTASTSGFVVLSTGTATNIRTGLQHPTPYLSVAVDLDRSGQRTLLDLAHENGSIVYAISTGQYPIRFVERIHSPISVADLDEDGFPEWVVGGDNRLYAFNHNGSLVTGFPVTIDPVQPVGAIRASVLIADLDGDAKSDLLVSTLDGRVFAYSARGRLLPGYPLSAGFAITATPLVGDLDEDGDLEIAVVSEDGFVYVWDLPAPFQTNGIKWGKYLRDSGNSGTYGDITPLGAQSEQLMPAKSVYNYPNPARGPSTTIRYYLSETSDVIIRIFDLAGHHVKTLRGPGMALTDNEVTWALSGVQSGVYFAKVQAVSLSGRRATQTVKIAVTR